MSEKKVRAVLYYRVSTDKQETANQVPELRREIAKRGWTLAKEYVDQAVSGGSTTRDELDKMMVELRAGRYDALVVQSYDRFGRDEVHLILTLDELVKRGIQFISVQEQIDTTTDVGRLAFTCLAGIAGFMRRQIGKKTKAALQRLKDDGVKLGRPTVPEEIKARVRALKAEGFSIRQIADQIEWVRAGGEYGRRKIAKISKSAVAKILAERPQIAPQSVAVPLDGASVA
jgi:DNA invertase Pin-like site-specific DNA recombinase